MRKFLTILIVANFSFGSIAQSREVSTPENPYENVSTTSTTLLPTIQTTAKESSGNNNKGKLLGLAAMGVTAAGVAMTCFSSNPATKAKCPYFAVGLAASIAVTQLMKGAKKKSDETYAAVTVGPEGQIADSGANTSGADYNGNPDYQAGMDALNELKKQGYVIDTATGVVTDPNGKKFSAETFASNASMSAAGYSSGQIAGFNAEKAKLMKAVEAKAKAADGTDMFGEDVGGGGGKTASVPSADGGLGGSYNLSGAGAAKAAGLGIDRDPAQVAGMTKNLGGELIGVSGDSLFGMIERRYNYLQTKDTFLTGP